jgi:hypothetical protein
MKGQVIRKIPNKYTISNNTIITTTMSIEVGNKNIKDITSKIMTMIEVILIFLSILNGIGTFLLLMKT